MTEPNETEKPKMPAKAEQLLALMQMIGNIPRCEWGSFLDGKGYSNTDLSDMSDKANDLSVMFGEIAAYLDWRGGGGCGDHGHEKAMKDAQVTRKRVRKALGYTYP